MDGVRSVAMGIWLRRGSRDENDGEGGLAHFIEHMVFKGTEKRSQAQIAQEMDAIGGQTDAFTTQEYAGFHVKVLDQHVPRAVDLLSDIVLSPRFDRDELERERRVIFEEIKTVEDNPEEFAHELFAQAFWPDHPLGRPILGQPETVARFDRDDLLRFFRRTYAPSNMIVVAAGNVEHEQLLSLVESRFARLETPPDGILATPPQPSMTVRLEDKDLEQAHIVLGTVAPSQTSSDRFVSYVLNAILGGSLSSRLFQVIREEHGLAYTVYSALSAFSDAGQLMVYAGSDPKKVPEVVDLVLHELRLIRDIPVQVEELRRAKDHLCGSILMGLESTDARMSQLARQELYFGRHIATEEAIQGIDSVTADDLLRLASSIFQRPLAMTVVGRLGRLEWIPESLVA